MGEGHRDRDGLAGNMALGMKASSAFLTAAVASLPLASLGFVVPVRVASPAERTQASGSATTAHVALSVHRGPSHHHQGSGGRAMGRSSLQRSSAAEVDVVEGGSVAGEEGLLWAEKRFPGCSVVQSKVRLPTGCCRITTHVLRTPIT